MKTDTTTSEAILNAALDDARKGQWLNVLASLVAANSIAIQHLNDALKRRPPERGDRG